MVVVVGGVFSPYSAVIASEDRSIHRGRVWMLHLLLFLIIIITVPERPKHSQHQQLKSFNLLEINPLQA